MSSVIARLAFKNYFPYKLFSNVKVIQNLITMLYM